jgi:hypothetical protein
MVAYLANYDHPAAPKIEDIALAVNEKARRIKAQTKNINKITSCATALKLHQPEEIIDQLFSPIYAIC